MPSTLVANSRLVAGPAFLAYMAARLFRHRETGRDAAGRDAPGSATSTVSAVTDRTLT